jgi:hypothetical protein
MREDAHRFASPAEQAALRQAQSSDHAQADDASFESERRALQDALFEIRRELAEVKFDLAWRRFCRKYGYNPDQPRDEQGRWTDSGGSDRVANRLGRGGGRSLGSFPDATPAQQARLAVAGARAQAAFQRVRQLDPNWQPSGSMRSGIEGAIREANDRASEADARYDQLRSGIGGNFGPPLDQPGGPSRNAVSEPNAQALIDAYRSIHNMPDLFGQATWPMDKGTVAVSKVGDTTYFGVNSRAPGYTEGDQNDAIAWRSTLIGKYPATMATGNVGGTPNDALYHAEATVILRAAKDSGGSLAGQTMEVQTDRDLCDSCQKVLPILGVELGNPTVEFLNSRTGDRWVMRDGVWIVRAGK